MFQEHRFAASGGTDDRSYFAARAVEINTAQNFLAAEAAMQIANDYRGVDFLAISGHLTNSSSKIPKPGRAYRAAI
jgi:hypothetical protein